MQNYITFTLLTLIWLISSCTSDNDQLASYCIDFDLRQCEGNPWLTNNQLPDTDQEHLALLTDFLQNKGITVIQSEIDNTFHDIVCQACFVCPAGPRIRVGVFAKDTAAIYALQLLNIGTSECPDEF